MCQKITLIQVEIAREDYMHIRDRYLRQEGWTHNCASPDHRWRWTKKFPSIIGTLTLNADEAFAVQQRLDTGEQDDNDGE